MPQIAVLDEGGPEENDERSAEAFAAAHLPRVLRFAVMVSPPGTDPKDIHVQPGTLGRPDAGPGWTLRFAVPHSAPPVPVSPPAPGRVAGVSVTFADVRASDHYIVVVVDAVGTDQRDIYQVTGPTALSDPKGGHVPNMHGTGLPLEPAPGGLHDHEELYWPRQGSGTYHLVVGPYQGQRLDRYIHVP
jgi:hypothetical protein